MTSALRVALCTCVAAAAPLVAWAAVVPDQPSRFAARVVHDPADRLGMVAESPGQLPEFEARRAGWEEFARTAGPGSRVWIDRRSGTPTLVDGTSIRWFPAGQLLPNAQLEGKARQFVSAHASLLGVRESDLVWNAEASALSDPDRRVVVFDRAVGGVPVEGDRFLLYVTRGSLVSFGATRWGPIDAVPQAAYGEQTARALLYAHMGLTGADAVQEPEPARQVLAALPSSGDPTARYLGPVGEGVRYALAWRFTVRVDGDPGIWVGKVDAGTGEILSFEDDVKYARLKGGVYPLSNDGNCADLGCELAGFPLPWANLTIGRKPFVTNDEGIFTCPKGNKTTTTVLAGTYVRVSDRCSGLDEAGSCNSDIDLGTSGGTDCVVPAGHNPGDTHASRSSFYHLNRIKEKGRFWLPGNAWLQGQLVSDVNIFSTCNAFWDGQVNFYRSGGGCRNTGEIAGVMHHEYGHGLDQNDGGGFDNPSEAYGDVVAMLSDRRSCVGRGFYQSGSCSGYGDSCLSCSGIRDMDWDQRVRHTPATPANFDAVNCPFGGSPCGREVHCAAYVPAEAVFDLATRDLPAAGLDTETAWQTAERLFYKSRQGSGGRAFNCALPSSDGCNVGSWFNSIRAADDDDGNLGNGTPHAAAIFAAFSRHAIACGTAADPGNQSTTVCPVLGTATVSASPGSGAVTLSWPAVPGAAQYLVLRNDIACGASSNGIATVSATSYTDTDVPSAFPLNYRVQAIGSNSACLGAVSACVTASAN